uniref:Putative secreted protein n=1 Tax=Ixodes ricinus TaxID=34613 RepID=A0A6B0U4T7_IXORI
MQIFSFFFISLLALLRRVAKLSFFYFFMSPCFYICSSGLRAGHLWKDCGHLRAGRSASTSRGFETPALDREVNWHYTVFSRETDK